MKDPDMAAIANAEIEMMDIATEVIENTAEAEVGTVIEIEVEAEVLAWIRSSVTTPVISVYPRGVYTQRCS